jgi:hypothetical protein
MDFMEKKSPNPSVAGMTVIKGIRRFPAGSWSPQDKTRNAARPAAKKGRRNPATALLLAFLKPGNSIGPRPRIDKILSIKLHAGTLFVKRAS